MYKMRIIAILLSWGSCEENEIICVKCLLGRVAQNEQYMNTSYYYVCYFYHKARNLCIQ